MGPTCRKCLQLLLFLMPVAWAGPKIDASCSACKAIASELQTRIDNEPVRNHLDMRHRLDSTGQRYGKVIDYKSSELRVVELLEDLCDSVKKGWTLVTVKTNTSEGGEKKTIHWEKLHLAPAGSRPDSSEEEARQKQLSTYCGRVLEEYDEDLSEAIRSGKLDAHGVAGWLCDELLEVCPPNRQTKSKTAASGESETEAASQQTSTTPSPQPAEAQAKEADVEAAEGEADSEEMGSMPPKFVFHDIDGSGMPDIYKDEL